MILEFDCSRVCFVIVPLLKSATDVNSPSTGWGKTSRIVSPTCSACVGRGTQHSLPNRFCSYSKFVSWSSSLGSKCCWLLELSKMLCGWCFSNFHIVVGFGVVNRLSGCLFWRWTIWRNCNCLSLLQWSSSFGFLYSWRIIF